MTLQLSRDEMEPVLSQADLPVVDSTEAKP